MSRLLAAVALVLSAVPTLAQTQSAPRSFEAMRDRVNAWTVGLAAGLIEGAPLRLAAEMGRVVDDGPNLLLLPIVTRGPTENLNALLYLKGVDLAIINTDRSRNTRPTCPTSASTSSICSTSSPPSCTSSCGRRSGACRTSPERR